MDYEIKASGKSNNRKSGALVAHRARLSSEAAERNSAYAKLTPIEKLARLDMGGFVATRQRTRLLAQIAATDAKKQTQVRGAK